ncbi:MAG: 4'-phosphopantetheinyl transferase superfamily protein [Alphaproteobacteria bacterium]|nr:4'-phosphopantetheinyl transferase superfamily protein [Alphaproteobacteria bacterium]
MFNFIPILLPEEVHIWSVCLTDNEKNIPYFMSLLSEDEHQKANKFKFPKDKNCFIISRGILRFLLGKYLEKNPKNIDFTYGLSGKPSLPEQFVYFNLSHSKDYVVYAVTRNYEVGIDVEYINKNIKVDDIVLNILSSEEKNYWKNVKLEEKITTFFKLWVCKEAFLKASGKGWLYTQQISLLDKIIFFKKDNPMDKLNTEMPHPFYFEFIPGYASAFFIEGPLLRPIYSTWESTM